MNQEIIIAEWRRSAKSLQAAELLVGEDYCEDAVSRAYYAILHAAKAALLVHDVVTTSHAGVRQMFGKHLVRTGEIEAQWSKYLAENFDVRLMADYDVGISFSSEETRQEYERAKAFLDRIRRYLIESGLTEQELETESDVG